MATDVNIVIKATDQASAVLDKVSKNTKKTGTSFTDAFKKAGVAVAGVTAAVYAVGAAFDAVLKFGKEGAQLEYAASKFNRLSSSIGMTSDKLMNDLRRATSGMMSDAELMAQAGDIMGLGLAKTGDQLIRLTTIASGLGMDMNQLVLTLTNQTTMRFDQLNVSVDGFDKRLKKLKDSGMDANSAFTEAFLQQAEQQLEKIGSKADTDAGKIARMEASWKNFGDTMKLLVAPAIADVAEALSEATNDSMVASRMKGEGLSRQETTQIITAQRKMKEANDAYSDSLKAQADAYNAKIAAQDAAEDANRKYASSVERMAMEEEFASDMGSSMTYFLRESAAAAAAAAEKAQLMADASADLANASADLAEKQANWKQEVGGDMGRLLADAGLSADDYSKALDATDDVMGTSLKPAYDLQLAQQELIDEFKRTGDINAYKQGLQEITDGFMPLNESITDATELVDILQQKLLLLERGYYATVNIIEKRGGSFDFTGVPDDRGGQKIGGEADGATGLDFIVPPGYPNDSYRINVQSGEHVQVTPAGEVGRSSGAGGNTYNIFTSDRPGRIMTALKISELMGGAA